MPPTLTADAFLATLVAQRSDPERTKISRHYRARDIEAEIIGVRMKHVFDTAKAFTDMPLDEVERLLESPYYEARLGAVSVMDFQTRRKRTTDERRRALYDLYLRRHDRIDNWDLVDRSAPRVIGWYLLDKPRDPLFRLAESANPWERRTAVTAAFWFIRDGDLDDALRLSEILLHDPDEYVNKSVGTALREAGNVDRQRLVDFLERHASSMPTVTSRYATERLPEDEKQRLRHLAGRNRATRHQRPSLG